MLGPEDYTVLRRRAVQRHDSEWGITTSFTTAQNRLCLCGARISFTWFLWADTVFIDLKKKKKKTSDGKSMTCYDSIQRTNGYIPEKASVDCMGVCLLTVFNNDLMPAHFLANWKKRLLVTGKMFVVAQKHKLYSETGTKIGNVEPNTSTDISGRNSDRYQAVSHNLESYWQSEPSSHCSEDLCEVTHQQIQHHSTALYFSRNFCQK